MNRTCEVCLLREKEKTQQETTHTHQKNTLSPEILQSGADSTSLFSRTGGDSDPLVFSNTRHVAPLA